MHVAVLCCIHNSELSMHDVGQMILSVADTPLVACTPTVLMMQVADLLCSCTHSMELGTHDTEG